MLESVGQGTPVSAERRSKLRESQAAFVGDGDNVEFLVGEPYLGLFPGRSDGSIGRPLCVLTSDKAL